MASLEITSAEKHEGDVTCIAHHNGLVFSGGADGKLKVWDSELQLQRTVDIHEAYIYAVAVNAQGTVYCSSCDGSVKYWNPAEPERITELVRCDDVIQTLYCFGEELYTGDEKGVVAKWVKNKIVFKYNLVEEVKTLAVEDTLIYTARDLDMVVSEMVSAKTGKYTNKATIPGKSPLTLLGAIVENKHSLVAFVERDGKGLNVAKNLPGEKFALLWTIKDCHEMIINGICGSENFLYSGGYDGKVKQWTKINTPNAALGGAVDVGGCINSICLGSDDKKVFVASTDGFVRRLGFA